MNNFVKMTKMTAKSGGIKGRSDYISDHDRQENLIYASEPVDWKPYRDFERKNQKSDTPNNEGRELIIALPNVWDKFPQEELIEKVKDLAEFAIEKNSDYQFAIHYNSSRTNLHVHVIFSERSMTDEVDYYKKDVFLQENGKVARVKKDRATDEAGNELAAVHKKGDIKNAGFTPKDKRYTQKGWLENTKERISDYYKKQGIDIEKPKIFELHQYHEGKGSESEIIRSKNEVIKTANDYLLLSEKKGVPEEQLIKQKKNILRDIFANKIDFIKEKLDNLINMLQPKKSEAFKFDLSNDKEKSRPVEPEFQPFTDDEIEIYNLYKNKNILKQGYDHIKETLKSKLTWKNNFKNALDNNSAKEKYKEYHRLQGTIFGKTKAKKYYNEHHEIIDLYSKVLKIDEEKDWKLFDSEVRVLQKDQKTTADEIKKIDERVKGIVADSSKPVRIDEKDVLSGKSLADIEKSLKSKNKPLEFEPSPEKTPYRQQSLSDALKDAQKSADEYNKHRTHRTRGNDMER